MHELKFKIWVYLYVVNLKCLEKVIYYTDMKATFSNKKNIFNKSLEFKIIIIGIII